MTGSHTNPMGAARRATALALALVGAAPPAGAVELTRAKVVALAAEQSPLVAKARAEVAAARALQARARAARWPEITVLAAVGPGLKAELVPGTAVQSVESAYDVELDDLTATVGTNVSVLQPLYTFGKIEDRLEAARLGIAAREAQAEVTRGEVALEAARLFEAYLFARDAALFMEEIVHTAERSLEQALEEVELEGSRVTEKDVLRLRAAMRAAQLGLNKARTGQALALAGLRAYLGVPDEEPIEFAPGVLEPLATEPDPVEAVIAVALENRAEFPALRYGIAAFEKLAEAERAAWYPDFFALGTVDARYTPGRDLVETRYVVDPLYHFVPAVIVGLRWTFQGGLTAARAAEMEAEAAKLEGLLRWARQGVPAEVRRAYEEIRRARADLEAASAGIDEAKRWLVRARLDFAAGLSGADDLTDAVTAYTELRLAALDAIYRLNTGLAELGRATGTLTEDGGPYIGGTEP